jgi:hypothetical protein
MTNEEILKLYEEFLAYYKGNVPSMEHEPIRFQAYVKMFKYYNNIKI